MHDYKTRTCSGDIALNEAAQYIIEHGEKWLSCFEFFRIQTSLRMHILTFFRAQ